MENDQLPIIPSGVRWLAIASLFLGSLGLSGCKEQPQIKAGSSVITTYDTNLDLPGDGRIAGERVAKGIKGKAMYDSVTSHNPHLGDPTCQVVVDFPGLPPGVVLCDALTLVADPDS